MVWGYISASCVQIFLKNDGIMDSEKYRYHATLSEEHLIGSGFIFGHDYDPKHTECSKNIAGYKSIEPIDLNVTETRLCINFVFTLPYCISVYYCMFLVSHIFIHACSAQNQSNV